MKFKGSTLIESLIALTIIALAFGIALITFISIGNSAQLRRNEWAHQTIRSIAIETKATNKFINDSYPVEGIIFIKNFEKVNDRGLLKIEIKALTTDSVSIEDYNEFVISDEKN